MRRCVLLCLGCFVVLTWCTFSAEVPRGGGRLVVVVREPPEKLDPHLMHFLASYRIAAQIFQGLTTFDPETGAIVPELCESWEVSEDGLVWTFYLRRNVLFHHGREMTAEDVKFSYDRIRNPATGSTWTALYSSVESVEIVDPYTVQIKLQTPFAPLPEVLTWRSGAVVPKDVVEQYGNLNVHVIGTGPFMLKEYVERQYVILTRNPRYFKPNLPLLDEVVFKVLPEPVTQMAEMLAGTAQLALDVPYELLYPLERAGLEVHVMPSAWTSYIGFQLGLGGHPVGPTADLRVRQALAMAIDKKAIAEAATLGLGFPIDTTVPLGSGWDIKIPTYSRNIEKAKQLLAEAGYAQGVEIKALYAMPGGEIFERAIMAMASQAKEAGITIVPTPYEMGTYVQKRAEGDFGFWHTATVEGLDPYFRSQIYFLSETLGGSFNKNHYSNPEVDELLLRAAKETDRTIRMELYTRVFTIVFYEDLCWLPLYSRPIIYVKSPRLKDFYFTVLEIPILEKAWFY